MFSLSNLSIRGKVLLIVGIGILFQIVIATVGLYYLQLSNESLSTTVDVEAQAIRQAARVRASFLDLVISEKNMITAKDEATESRHRATFDADQRELEVRLGSLREVAGEIAPADAAAFEEAYGEYLVNHERIRELSARNEDLAAAELSTGEAREHADAARAALVSLMDGLDKALDQRALDNAANARTVMTLVIGVLLATLLVSFGAGVVVTRSITTGLGELVEVAGSIARGDLDNRIEVAGQDEVAGLATAVDGMQTSLRQAREESEAQDWLKSGLTRLADIMRGELTVADLAAKVTTEMATYLDAKVGAFYAMSTADGSESLSLLGSYAYTKRKNLSNRFEPGSGLVGQAALERQQILISNVPDDYIKVTSGLGEAAPRQICVTPVLFEGAVKGVVELAVLLPMTELQLEYVRQAMPAIAITLETAEARDRLRLALEEAQRLTEELQVQQEELQSANEELEEQTQRLQQSEERLRAQQEEMEVVNEELEEKNELLERQKKEVELARRDIAEKAEDLALASRYKSEFLANMSHELRTPLNSLLLLARGFVDNREGNLSERQVEEARVIHQGGHDLLSLINEILDLSKIEAGRMDLRPTEVRIADLAASTRDSFDHLAQERGLDLTVSVLEGAPETLSTDRGRLEQVIRNLVSNALKFTERGSVTVTFGRPGPEVDLRRGGHSPERSLAITVQDTGIGIAAEQHKVVFEAFQQADGGIARKAGGTGLGLSISRELVRLLGGEIQLRSEPGQGSTFTVVLPLQPPSGGDAGGLAPFRATAARNPSPPGTGEPVRPETPQVPDDRESLRPEDTVVLVVEDDSRFAALLIQQCQDRGLKVLAAGSGEQGVELARRHQPRGIILDLKLPGLDGWGVLEILKGDPATRHIPVHIMSVEEPSGEALRRGAVGHLRKPVTREDIDAALDKLRQTAESRIKNVLVVEDDETVRHSIVELIADEQVHVDEAAGAQQAIEALRTGSYDCMVLDLGLWDMDGDLLLKRVEAEGIETPPVIVHTARDLTREEEAELRAYSDSIIIKDVRSQERLLDEVSLFLHRVVAEMPEPKRKVIADLHDPEGSLRDKTVLIVDDDMRTVFALSRFLSDRGMTVLRAENGLKALGILTEHTGVDLVLMDIMMPVLDGLETMRRIRAQERFRRLPIIALTAKAMKGDQEQCMAAGASDYMPKPVDQDRLLSMMRVWLYR